MWKFMAALGLVMYGVIERYQVRPNAWNKGPSILCVATGRVK